MESKVKSLLRQEEQQTQARIIKYILQKQKDASFSYVTTTKLDSTIVEHHNKTDIEKVLCAENQ